MDLAAFPSNDRLLIFANPIAGRGEGVKIAHQLADHFRSHRRSVKVFLKKPADLSDDDLGEQAGAAIVIGGDGTLRGVAQRLLAAGKLAPLLPVPLGTANLMGRHLGIRWDRDDIVRQVSHVINAPRVRFLDAGKANDQVFLLIAGVGFDGQVVECLHQRRQGPIRFWDYFMPLCVSFSEFPSSPLRVVLDGMEIFGEEPALAFVGNLPEYGTGFPVVPFARADDGLLDVCVLPCRSQAELIKLLLLAAAGEHVQGEGVVYRRGKHVRIESPASVPVQVDGDPAGFTPIQIDLLPVRLPFIVP